MSIKSRNPTVHEELRVVFKSALFSLATFAVATEAIADVARYSIRLLPTVADASFVRAFDVNDNGDVLALVGSTASEWSRSVIYRAEQVDEMPFTAIRTSGNGVIAGGSYVRDGDRVFELPSMNPHLPAVSVRAVNDRAQGTGIVYGFVDGTFTVRAALWTNGIPRDLGTLGGAFGTETVATGISNRGAVVGQSANAAGLLRPFLWTESGMRDIGHNGFAGGATAINNSEEVVGWTASDSTSSRAFLWSNGHLRLLHEPVGSIMTTAHDINDSTVIVGNGMDGLGRQRALAWTDGVALDLTASIGAQSEWVLIDAVGVNARGQIVGNGSFNGEDRAFLLTPLLDAGSVPEPSGVVGLISGLLLLRKRSAPTPCVRDRKLTGR